MEKTKKLTDKEMQFAQGVIEGKTQYQSFLDTYGVKTEKRDSIDSMASKIANRPHVAKYLSDMRRRKEEKAIFTGFLTDEQKREIIKKRIESCIESGNDAAIARYMDILNKMDGVYINLTKTVNDEKPALSDLSSEDLQALLNTV